MATLPPVASRALSLRTRRVFSVHRRVDVGGWRPAQEYLEGAGVAALSGPVDGQLAVGFLALVAPVDGTNLVRPFLRYDMLPEREWKKQRWGGEVAVRAH